MRIERKVKSNCSEWDQCIESEEDLISVSNNVDRIKAALDSKEEKDWDEIRNRDQSKL